MKSLLSTSLSLLVLTASALATPALKTRQAGAVIRSCTTVSRLLRLFEGIPNPLL